MTTANKNTIESALRRAGINAEVFKGDGYFYFVGRPNSYLDVGRYSTSVYGVCYYSHMSIERWVEEAQFIIKRNMEI